MKALLLVVFLAGCGEGFDVGDVEDVEDAIELSSDSTEPDESGPDVEVEVSPDTEDVVETSPDSVVPDDSGPDTADVVEVSPDSAVPDDSGIDTADVVEVSPDTGPDDAEEYSEVADSEDGIDAEDVPEVVEVAPPPTPCGYFSLRWDDFEDVVLGSPIAIWGPVGYVEGGPFDIWRVVSQERGGVMSQVALAPSLSWVIRWDRYLSSPTDLWAVSFWVSFRQVVPGFTCEGGICATLANSLYFHDDGCVRSRWDSRPCPATWTPDAWIHITYRESECRGFTVDGVHVDGPTGTALCRTATQGYFEVSTSRGWMPLFDDACMAWYLPG